MAQRDTDRTTGTGTCSKADAGKEMATAKPSTHGCPEGCPDGSPIIGVAGSTPAARQWLQGFRTLSVTEQQYVLGAIYDTATASGAIGTETFVRAASFRALARKMVETEMVLMGGASCGPPSDTGC